MNGNTRWLLVSVLFALGAIAWWSQAGAAQEEHPGLGLGPQATGDGSGLVSHVISQPGRPHTVVVADPGAAVLAVYHVDAHSGALSLKSVRNVSWDLKMMHFNSGDPSPQDVRAGLPR